MEYFSLAGLIQKNAAELGEATALKTRNDQTQSWDSISWNTFQEKIAATAHSLCRFGIREQSAVGICSENKAECFYLDFALYSNRAIAVPMYATSSTSQIAYIVRDANISLLFVGDQAQYDHAFTVLTENSDILKQLVILNNQVIKNPEDDRSLYFDEFTSPQYHTQDILQTVEKRKKEVRPEDIVHLIYTSGTTGNPKGVILTQENFAKAIQIHAERLILPRGFVSMCFLPLTHIFEKAWSILCLNLGCTLAINADPKNIRETIREVKPQAMCSVPRFWEKVYAGVQDRIEQSGPILQAVFRDAFRTGHNYIFEYRNKEKKAPWFLRAKFGFYNKTVFQALKKNIGIENGIIFPCAGAALSDTINTFIQSVNIPLVYGYGLTETTATVSCFTKTRYEIGTVGKIMPDIEVRIGEESEIQVKGKTVMPGYFNKPEETAQAFTPDGWFRTGDAGYLTEENNIVLTDRIKDLYKTSNGKYIAPQQIEMRLAEDKLIEMAAVIGNQRKYVTALIIPDFAELQLFAKNHRIAFRNQKELCENPLILKEFEKRLSQMQEVFANFEKIKRFTLLPEAFTIASGELTNTLKMKRAFIEEKYKEIIDAMYPKD